MLHNTLAGKSTVIVAAHALLWCESIKRNLLPLTGAVLTIAHIHRIGRNLAHIMKQRNRHEFIHRVLAGHIEVCKLHQPLCNGDRVFAQAACLRAMEFGTCRCLIEIRCFQPCHHLIDAGTGDVLCHLDKLFFRSHSNFSFSDLKCKKAGSPVMGSPP